MFKVRLGRAIFGLPCSFLGNGKGKEKGKRWVELRKVPGSSTGSLNPELSTSSRNSLSSRNDTFSIIDLPDCLLPAVVLSLHERHRHTFYSIRRQ
jgi:hypothetical protein